MATDPLWNAAGDIAYATGDDAGTVLPIGTVGHVLTVGAGTVPTWAAATGGTAGGASTFLELTDTPAAYTGQGGKFVAVKSDASGLEFVASPEVGGLSFGLLDIELSSVDWAIA
jgi:hypothetical protein